MNFTEIDKLVGPSGQPLDDEELEGITVEKHPYHRFLYHLVKQYNVKCAIELGVWNGVGSWHMARAGAHAIGIDINPVMYSYMFHFIHGDTTDPKVFEQVKKYVELCGGVGLVYQDSSHHFLPSVREWELYSSICKNAIWVCDDITTSFGDENGTMVDYWNTLPEPKKLYKDVLHYGNTMGVILNV